MIWGLWMLGLGFLLVWFRVGLGFVFRVGLGFVLGLV